MGYANSAGLGVNNFYGARDTLAGTGVGLEHGEDSCHRLSISFSGASLNDAFMPPVSVPKGALFKSAVLRIDEAFVVTGTTPTLLIGVAGGELANGIAISEAELEAIGTKTPASTGAGTWAQNSATGTTAAAKVGKALGGGTPAVSAAVGRGTLILTFVNKTKV